MNQPGSIQKFVGTIQDAWTAWDKLIMQFDKEQLRSLVVMGNWSLKDIIAHITWFEKEMVGLITAHALVGSELWNLPTDERNAAIYEEIRDQSLEQVLSESEQVHQQLLEVLPTLSDEDLTTPGNFPNMPPYWQPWSLIAQNTYEHYQQHIPDIQNWITKTQKQ